MLLMDAMLNEGYRDPCDVYLALRTDGAMGSGTIDDPFDGSAVTGPVLAISTLTYDGRDVIVEAEVSDFQVNDTVILERVVASVAAASNLGRWTIFRLQGELGKNCAA